MSRKSVGIWGFILGVILIASGVACIINPGAALGGLSVVLGLVMLLSGIGSICIYGTVGGLMLGSGWLLLDGILTVVLAIFVLGNSVFTALTLPLLVGLWLLFTGVGGIVSSLELRRSGVPGWGFLAAAGVIGAIAGFVSFCDPLVGAVAIAVIVGILLILQGAAAIVWSVMSSRLWR